MPAPWLLCSYKLPRDPSRLRLAVWRRLRRLGALMLHDGLWALPAEARTREDFDWLAEEIEELGGTVFLWESESRDPAQDAVLAGAFRAEAERRYTELAEAAKQLAKLSRRKALAPGSVEQVMQRLRKLEVAMRLERRRDYFKAPGRRAAEAELASAVELVRARLETPDRNRRPRAVGD